MTDHTNPRLTDLTSTSPTQRAELLRWFSDMSVAEQLHVLELQRSLLRRHANQKIKPSPTVALATLVEALAKRSATLEVLGKKGWGTEEESKEKLRLLMRMRADALKKDREEGKKERKYRLQFHGLVRDLREEGLGWRTCAEYLKKHERFTISHQRLRQLYFKFSKQEETPNADN